MEKYEDEHMENMSRAVRNKKIYSSLDFDDLSRIKTNDNVSVISDAEKEIDIEKIKNYINSMDEEKPEKRKRISLEIPTEDYQEEIKEEERDYDINSVLERAKDKRDVINNLINTCDKLLLGGAMCFTFLKAKGYSVGKNEVVEDKLEYAKNLLETNSKKTNISPILTF